jgi:hypothetical protein
MKRFSSATAPSKQPPPTGVIDPDLKAIRSSGGAWRHLKASGRRLSIPPVKLSSPSVRTLRQGNISISECSLDVRQNVGEHRCRYHAANLNSS